MWIERAEIKNFGKLNDRKFEFSPGFNVIYGENEAGKTTLQHFLTGMLFGIEKSRGRANDVYTAYEPWNSASYFVGNMVMQIAEKRFLLERNFYHKEKTVKLRNLLDHELLSVEMGDLEMLLGGMTKENYENTYCIRQAGFLADDSLAGALESYMADVSNSGDGSVRLQAAIEELGKKRRKAEKERKGIQGERQEKIRQLTTELEILKEDISFQKSSELAVTMERQQERELAREKENGQKKYPAFLEKVLFILIVAALILLFGKIMSRILGVILLAGSIAAVFLLRAYRKMEEQRESLIVNSEIAEGLAEMKEQWTEKENRYRNVEEQLQELSESSPREEELTEDIKALEMAAQVMQAISQEIYEDVSDSLQREVSKNLSAITGGKYDSMILDKELHLYIWEGGKKLPVAQLSRGTLEQAYFAMRMAVGKILTREESMPVLLDETFSMYDDKRLVDTLRWLSSYQGQILLFSCQKRELHALDNLNIPYQKIELT
ncbi:MAG: AAA family ATPase [Lachnospiraceae bacterium]|nr:AAA family ATPase [Lachnospiraceae bacterium]